ncbi:MAG: YcxB family protein [Candidatus Thiodiazotropha sp.]
MEIEITLIREDWKKFHSFIEKDILRSKSRKTSSHLGQFVIWVLLGVAFMAVFQQLSHFHWPTAVSVAAVFAIIFGLFIYELNKLKQLYAPSDAGPFVGAHRFNINEEGIYSQGDGYRGFHSWSVVKRIVRNNGMVLMMIDTAYGYVFPESHLDNPEQFIQYITECSNNAW